MKLFTVVLALVWLAGCASTRQEFTVSPSTLLNDAAFSGYERVNIESEADVFGLDAEAKAFVAKAINPMHDPTEQMEDLVEAIFDRADLNLLYMGAANTTATQTFHNQAANCLSLSIMTYALAKEAGFAVKFQDIEIPEYWTRRDGFSLLNGHINLRLMPQHIGNVINLLETGYEVDFDPQAPRQHFPKRLVGRDTVLAMFYNNKGADALVNEDYKRAYAYFRAAALTKPTFDSVWVNLAILYRMTEHYGLSEKAYEVALKLDPENLTAMENLAFLYANTGRQQQAEELEAVVERRRVNNPFYHFILGEQAFDEGQLDEALSHYRDALRLDKSRHEIYFGLAKTYFQMGDISRSARYFKQASMKAFTAEDRHRYNGKLDLLTQRHASL
ncbi:tetratricopeptide repeat protein [Aestuariibacter halophilus]|uniref:Tetratricopeptide repeat protein n=1 Tax=Fluctibacter halophilus TaxID=226011 RepID=A0ABS8G768_9ALTE|nr:tetratricopeptide repeat protein [Aestuariibacter halophilus]MCC2616385.1 tetratricopeptide repeat protein [Aestuariibacter halophilus]